MQTSRVTLAVLATLALVLGAPPAGADDYTDPEYHAALLPTAGQTWLDNLGEQAAGLPHGR